MKKFLMMLLLAALILIGCTAKQPSGKPVTTGPDIRSEGNESAKVVIVEFSDFQCPFCGRFYMETLPQIQANYINTGKVRFVYKHFPLSQIHAFSFKAAEASECAADQGKFWQMHNMLYENQEKLSVPDIKGYASELGLDLTQFNQCLDSGTKANKVRNDLSEGQQLGVDGTPSFFVNDQVLVGALPYSDFKKAIDVELSK